MPPLSHYAFDILARNVLSSDPPARRTRETNHATLLVSWWCTIFALVIILLRLSGRWVRSETLFREDKVVAISIIPLMLRMGCAHVLLLFGTNNADSTGISVHGAQNRVVGSKVVLVSRILYALFIWIAKLTVAEFLRRLASAIWTKTYEKVLRGIRWFLVLTFFAVVVATLAECRPFHYYWKVVPTPKPSCRTGFAQVLTMGITDMITDVVLIGFPIPIILRSSMPLKRKVSLICLFSLSIFLIVITAYRMYAIIEAGGRQQLRTLWASIEILAAAAVSNCLVLGSFMRDRGVKKTRYRASSSRSDSLSATESFVPQPSIARKMTLQHWGSDEDLFREVGCRVQSSQRPGESISSAVERCRKASDAVMLHPANHGKTNWLRPDGTSDSLDGSSSTLDSDTITVEKLTHSEGNSHHNSSSDPSSSSRTHYLDDTSLSDVGNILGESRNPPAPTVHTFDFAMQHPPRDASRGRSTVSKAGELLFPRHSHTLGGGRSRSPGPRIYTPSPGPRSIPKAPVLHHPDYTSYQRSGEDQPLGDAGGLLSAPTPAKPAAAAKTRRTSALSQVIEMTSRGRLSSSQTRTPTRVREERNLGESGLARDVRVSPKTISRAKW